MKDKILKVGKIIFYFSSIFLLILAIIYRTKVWLFEPGFFGDEGALISNLQNRNLWQLFLPLDENQCCPPFVLCCFKLLYVLFGLNETALRFFSYLSGLASLILAFFVGRKVFKFESTSLLLITFMFFHVDLVYYSQEFKQYSSDVFFALLMPFVFLLFKDKIVTVKQALCFGIFLGLSGFASLPSEFAVVPICFYFLFKCLKEKKYKLLLSMSLPYILLSACLFFLMVLGTLKGGMLGLSMWAEGCDTFKSLETVKSLFDFILGYKFVLITQFMFLAGIIYLAIKDRLLLLLFGAPILLNIIFGYCHLYPFTESRVILWLTPFTMIIAFKLIDVFKTKNDIANIIFEILIFSCAIFCFFNFDKTKIDKISANVPYYFYRSNAREYVEKLEKQSVKPDDVIFVDAQGQGIFGVYDKNHKYHGKNVIYQNYQQDLSYFDPNQIIISKQVKHIDDLPKGTCIWFYNSSLYGKEVFSENVALWISENTKVLRKETDAFGDFYYTKKIK